MAERVSEQLPPVEEATEPWFAASLAHLLAVGTSLQRHLETRVHGYSYARNRMQDLRTLVQDVPDQKDCSICFEKKNTVTCAFQACRGEVCADCLSRTYIGAGQGGTARPQRLGCVMPRCPGRYEQETLKFLSEGARAVVEELRANEAEIARNIRQSREEKAMQFMQRLEQTEKERLEKLLTNACPNCLADFDGCAALTCPVCNAQFCALCLEALAVDNAENHRHVAACTQQTHFRTPGQGLAPADVYISGAAWAIGNKRVHKQRMETYLDQIPPQFHQLKGVLAAYGLDILGSSE